MATRILIGDIRQRLAELPAESVHTVITSPPYYGLRDYGIEPQIWGGVPICAHEWGQALRKDGVGNNSAVRGASEVATVFGGFGPKHEQYRQGSASGGVFCTRCNAWRGSLGLEPTPDLYLDHMVEVCRAIRRVLRQDGTFWLVIGDSYHNVRPSPSVPQSMHNGELRDLTTGGNRSQRQSGLKGKDLMLVPSRLAIRLCDDGWWVRSDICWAKRSSMPESVVDRPTSAWEHVFLLAKSGDTTYWTHRNGQGTRSKPAPDYRYIDHDNRDDEVLTEPPNWRNTPAAQPKNAHPVNRIGGVTNLRPHGMTEDMTWDATTKRWSRINLWQAHDYFYDAEAVKEEARSDPVVRDKHAEGYHADFARGDRFSPGARIYGADGKRNLRNFWRLGPSPFPEAHFATFPPEIPRIAISAGTSEKGVCKTCGAPYERIVGKTPGLPRERDETRNCPPGTSSDGRNNISGAAHAAWKAAHPDSQLSWQPTCQCLDNTPIPATVLDPFFGAGTTGYMADRLGRDCIGIELNEAYTRLAANRVGDNAGFVFSGAVKVSPAPAVRTLIQRPR